MITIKGLWKSGNLFIKENGEEIKVNAMTYIYEQYKPLLPLNCFINISKDENIIYSVHPINLEPNSSL